jgi:lipopolysaccharide/colanic/teichoic acid biosynthesis glycosyltransferase
VSTPALDQRGAPAVELEAATVAPPAAAGWMVDASCRALDILVAGLLLIVTGPILLAIALIVRLDSEGPALFRQQRIGRDRKPFMVNKFRSMQVDSSHDSHRQFVVGLINGEEPRHDPQDAAGLDLELGEDGTPRPYYKMIADPRVTRFGRLLRRSSLDELPQLWNVLRGDMSLVGPRPPIQYEVDHYPPQWFERFAVKPGITGLWQVNGRSKVTLEEMVKLDIEYAHRRTLWLNLWILARTIPAVLGARGAW